jgi:hypothetical protein
MPTLGGIIGFDTQVMVDWCLAQVKLHDRLFSAIIHPSLPSQSALLILRMSALPRLDYLTRVLPPSVLNAAMVSFDAMVLQSVIRKLQLPSPLSDEAQSLLRLPIRMGGCGIRSLLSVAPAAYFGAMAIAAPFILNTINLFIHAPPEDASPSLSSASSPSPPSPPSPLSFPLALTLLYSLPISRHLSDCITSLKQVGIPPSSPLLPPATPDFWVLYGNGKRGLQKRLSQIIHTLSYDDLRLKTRDPLAKARFIACGVKHSGSWLNTVPSSPELFLMDAHFALAVRLRLGLPPQEKLPLECKCGAVLKTDPAHFLSCKLLKRTIVTARHDMLVRQIASFVRSAGGSVFIEPKYLEGKRADAQIYFTSDISLMDVQITHPAAPYYAISTNIASTPLGTARSREIAKHSKYDKQAKSEGASFYPFVMETYGGLGKEASVFVQKVSKLYIESSPFPINRNTFTTKMVKAFGITLQKGNALVQAAGCIAARNAAGERVGY